MKYLEKFKYHECSLALANNLSADIYKILQSESGKNMVLIGGYNPSEGQVRFTCLIDELFIPEEENYSNFIQTTSANLINKDKGIVLIGNENTINEYLKDKDHATTFNTSKFPVGILAIEADNSYKARLYTLEDEFIETSTVRVIGKKLKVYYNESFRPKPEFKEIYKRTVTVWGKENHDHLSRLRVGIIGLGSVGSIVAEALARMGIERFVLVDFDEVQLHNLDRLLGASVNDIGIPKVTIAERQIRVAATATNLEIVSVVGGVTEEKGYRHALDCDIIFSCVDRPWPRYVLNNLAYNHLIPVIDGGIQVRFNEQSLTFDGADWQLQSVGPERPCLECLGAYTPAHVLIEQAGKLEDPTYLAGLPDNHEFKRNENIFPFSINLASLEVLQFIEQVTGIGGTDYYGTQRFSYNEGYIRLNDTHKCQEGCFFQHGIAKGDTLFPPPIGLDITANLAKERQSKNDKL